jgi:tripartite-type tricarboxylate transporter receptor subunit TctC
MPPSVEERRSTRERAGITQNRKSPSRSLQAGAFDTSRMSERGMMRRSPSLGALARLVLVVAAGLASVAPRATAEPLPDRPIRLVVGFGAGGPTDILARALAEQLSGSLGRKVIVENRTGASGNIATQAVATAEADGATLLIGASPLAVNHSLFPDFPVKYGRDLTAVAALGATTNVLVVHPSFNVRTLAQFTQHVKERPGAVSYAVIGMGSVAHLAGVAFDLRAGTSMVPVSYRGVGEAIRDLLGGHVQAWFATVPAVLEQVRAGQLVAIATTGPERTNWLPDVPTMSELGLSGYDVRLWVGLFAPAKVSAERMQLLDGAVTRAMALPSLKSTMDTQRIAPLQLNQVEFHEFVLREIDRWQVVVAALKK